MLCLPKKYVTKFNYIHKYNYLIQETILYISIDIHPSLTKKTYKIYFVFWRKILLNLKCYHFEFLYALVVYKEKISETYCFNHSLKNYVQYAKIYITLYFGKHFRQILISKQHFYTRLNICSSKVQKLFETQQNMLNSSFFT